MLEKQTGGVGGLRSGCGSGGHTDEVQLTFRQVTESREKIIFFWGN